MSEQPMGTVRTRFLRFAMEGAWAMVGVGFLLTFFVLIATGGTIIGAKISPTEFFLGTKEGLVSVSKATFLASAIATFLLGLFAPVAICLEQLLSAKSFSNPNRSALTVVLFYVMLALWALFLVGHSARLIIRATA